MSKQIRLESTEQELAALRQWLKALLLEIIDMLTNEAARLRRAKDVSMRLLAAAERATESAEEEVPLDLSEAEADLRAGRVVSHEEAWKDESS